MQTRKFGCCWTTHLLFQTDNWRDTREQQIIDRTVPPTDDQESASMATLHRVPSPKRIGFGGFGPQLPGLLRMIDELSHATAQLRVRGVFALLVTSSRWRRRSGWSWLSGAFLAGSDHEPA